MIIYTFFFWKEKEIEIESSDQNSNPCSNSQTPEMSSSTTQEEHPNEQNPHTFGWTYSFLLKKKKKEQKFPNSCDLWREKSHTGVFQSSLSFAYETPQPIPNPVAKEILPELGFLRLDMGAEDSAHVTSWAFMQYFCWYSEMNPDTMLMFCLLWKQQHASV